MKKIILVTGGAGYVGSNLCEELSKNKNNKVYSLDNYFTGKKSNHVKNVNYISGDCKNIFDLIKFKPDLIFHLGEYSRVESSFDDVKIVWDLNKLSIYSILEFVRLNNCKLIYAASSTKFGVGREGSNSSPYAFSKSSNAQLVKNYGKWFGIKYAITYFYNVYGKNEISEGKYSTLIAIFKRLKKNNEILRVVKPGNQKRNFTHIDDIISGLIKVAEKGKGDNYGIGSDEIFSILDVVGLFDSDFEFLPPRKGNRMDAKLNTSKTKNLGWVPRNSLRDHINEFITKLNE